MLVDSLNSKRFILFSEGARNGTYRRRRCRQSCRTRSLPVLAVSRSEVFSNLSESVATPTVPQDTLTSQSQSAGRSLIEEASKATAKSEPLGAQSSTGRQAINSLQNQAQSGTNSGVDSAIDQAQQATSNADASASQAADSGGNLLDGLQNAFSGVSKSVTDAANNLKDSINGTIAGGQESISGSSEDIQRLTSGISRDFEGATGDVGKEISKQLTGFSDAAGSALQGASTSFETFQGAASGAAGNLGGQALQSANSVLDSLPPSLRDTLRAILTPLAQALEVPPIRNAAIVFAVGYPSYVWFTARFGGFSGRLSPQSALSILESEDAVLLDIRPDNARDIAGIPELRFGARNKGIALPLVRVKQKTGTQVVKANVLSFQVAAILIAGLNKVSKRSKIIVLSDSELQAVNLARAISEEIKLNAYILKGGFGGWVSAGLPIKDNTEYDSGPIQGFNDTVEGRLLPFLRDPVSSVGTVSLVGFLSAVLIDQHRTFQFIGAFGILFTLVTIPVRYSSLQEARNDILGPFLRVADFALKLVPKSSPKTRPQDSFSSSPSLSTSSQKQIPSPDDTYDDGYGDILKEDIPKEDTGTKVLTQQPRSEKDSAPKNDINLREVGKTPASGTQVLSKDPGEIKSKSQPSNSKSV